MSIIGSSWKEEYPSDDEIIKYNEITGENFYGSKDELQKRIEKISDSNFTSQKERKDLFKLSEDLNQNKNEK
jgi:hypothetical protein